MSDLEREQPTQGTEEDVEAHAKRFHIAEDAEPPEDIDRREDEERKPETDEDVEAHAKRFH